MSEPRYFVRTQGRVSGPFTVSQIQALHQRGHFGRFHEVSADQQAWQPAGTLAGLFPTSQPVAPRSFSNGEPAAEVSPGPGQQPMPVAPPPAPVPVEPTRVPPRSEAVDHSGPPEWQEVDWYYQGPGEEPQGPVSLAQLERFRREGTVVDSTLVCKPGMDSWIELSAALGGRVRFPNTTPSAAPGRAALRSVRVALLLALGGGIAAVVELAPLSLAYLLGISSGAGVALLSVAAGLMFGALLVELTAYTLCALSPVGGSGRSLAASALLLGATEFLLRVAALAGVDLAAALAAPGAGGGVVGLMVGAAGVAVSCGRTVLFEFYLCQAARDLGQPRVARALLQGLPLLVGAVLLGLLFLLAVLIGSASDLSATDRGAFDVAYLVGLSLVVGVWALWYIPYLASVVRLQAAVEAENSGSATS